MDSGDERHGRAVAVIAASDLAHHHTEQLEALVAACVLIAQVDGAVTPDERGRMVERLKQRAGLEGADLEAALQAFEALDARFDARPEETWVEAELMIRRLKGRAEAEAVAAAAVAVSIDGGLEAEERTAVLDICAWLDVSPLRVLP